MYKTIKEIVNDSKLKGSVFFHSSFEQKSKPLVYTKTLETSQDIVSLFITSDYDFVGGIGASRVRSYKLRFYSWSMGRVFTLPLRGNPFPRREQAIRALEVLKEIDLISIVKSLDEYTRKLIPRLERVK